MADFHEMLLVDSVCNTKSLSSLRYPHCFNLVTSWHIYTVARVSRCRLGHVHRVVYHRYLLQHDHRLVLLLHVRVVCQRRTVAPLQPSLELARYEPYVCLRL